MLNSNIFVVIIAIFAALLPAGLLFRYIYRQDSSTCAGSGLTRICNETRALEGYRDELKPQFKSTPTQFQTIIFASTDMPNVGDVSETKLTDRQQRIINLIKESPTITGRQMSETLSVSQRTIERDLSAMQKIGVLMREGKDNDGVWIVIN